MNLRYVLIANLFFGLLGAGAARGQEAMYSDSILKPEMLSKYMPASLAKDKAAFASRLETVFPVIETEGFYIGSGCQTHRCGRDETMWAIDSHTGRGTAIIMEYFPEIKGGAEASESFAIYGSTVADLPAPLTNWALERGMNEGNLREVPSVMEIIIK